MRGKPGWDWVPGEGYGNVSPWHDVIAVTPGNLVLVTPQGGSGLASDPRVATPDDTEELTVHRVVGQIAVRRDTEGDPGGPLTVNLRVAVGLIDPDSALAFYADNLSNDVDANEPFLWQRYVRLLAAGDETMSSFENPSWSAVDIRVKRRLSIDEALVLRFSYNMDSSQATNPQVELRHYLRVLVKRK